MSILLGEPLGAVGGLYVLVADVATGLIEFEGSGVKSFLVHEVYHRDTETSVFADQVERMGGGR